MISLSSILLSCETKEVQLQRFLLQGNGALSEQNYQGAEHYFQEALKMDPCFKDALNNLGVLYSNQKRFDVAIGYFTKTMECDPKFLPAYFNRANSYFESKEYYNLLKDTEYILKVKPDTALAFVLIGLANTQLGQYDIADSVFGKAIEREPNNSEHFVNRGTVKYYQKKLTDATNDFKKALTLKPSQANALNALGLIAVDKNQLDSAKNYFEQALRLIPDQPYFLNNLGYVYMIQKDLPKAVTLINKSITLDPDNAWAYRNKGIYYLAISEYASAERLLKQSLSMDKSVDRVHYYFGLALMKNGKPSEACEQFKRAQAVGDGLVKNEIRESCR